MDLVKESRKKGFISHENLIEVNDSYYYLWMHELQKWLRDIRHWNIIIFNDDGDIEYGNLRYNFELRWILPSFKRKDKKSIVGEGTYKTYEEALEDGLIEVLKLIKNGKS